MKLFSLRVIVAVLCFLAFTANDALAFGKRGKGLFGWRESSTCSSGSCSQSSQSFSGNSCQTCTTGACATGNCATTCENGNCLPSKVATTDTKASGIICVDGKCYTPEQFAKKFINGPVEVAPSPTPAGAWFTPAWKK